MSSVVRDVTIRVSLVNGNMNVGPADFSSLLDAVKAVQREMQERLGNIQIGPIDTTRIKGAFESVKSTAAQIQEAVKSAAASLQSAVNSVSKDGVPKSGMIGYGQSVRDRASGASAQVMAEMQSKGLGRDLSQQDLGKVQSRLATQAESRIRENDREASNAAQYAKQQRASVAQGAVSAAQGAAALYATGDNKDAERMQQTASAAQSLQSVFMGLTTVAAGLGVTIGAPFLIAAAAVTAAVGALAYWRLCVVEAAKVAKAESEAAMQRSRAATEYTLRRSTRETNHIYEVGELNATSKEAQLSINRSISNFKSRSQTEAAIQSFENDPDKTAEQKEAFRSRMEKTDRFREQRSESADKYQLAEQRLKTEQQAQKSLQASKPQIERQFTAEKFAVRRERLRIEKTPDRVDGSRSPEQEAELEKFKSGGIAEKQIDQRAAEAREAIENKIGQSLAQQIELHKQLAGAAIEIAEAKREEYVEANRVYQAEKERSKQHAIGIGVSDAGTINRRKMIQEKHDRIVAKQKENVKAGRDENEGIEQYTAEESRIALQYGDEASISVRAQAERVGAASGIRQEGWEEALKAKNRRDAAKEELDNDKHLNVARDHGDQIQQLTQQAQSSMTQKFNLGDLKDSIMNALEDLDADLKVLKTRLDSWTQKRRNE